MTEHIISTKNNLKAQQQAQTNYFFTLYVQYVIPAFDSKLTQIILKISFYLSIYLKCNTCKRMVAKAWVRTGPKVSKV